MAPATFTLVLTNATHLVSSSTADSIVEAIDAQKAYVDVQVDLFGDGSCVRRVRLMTQHVIMLMQNASEQQRDDEMHAVDDGKLRFIAPHRFR
jgi:hypothetical protein